MNTIHRPVRAGSLSWTLFLLACVLLVPGLALAVDSVAVTYKLEGCRNNGSVVLPNGSGQFVCADSLYTTGNLGKGWNELDLVPYRATLTAGNSAPATQTYLFTLAVDNCNSALGSLSTCADGSMGVQGYDFVSVPVLNTALSSASCAAPVSVSAMSIMAPGIGGEDVSVFRDVTVTQLKSTTCVYDYYSRLALGSHLYLGSSLHSYLVNPSGDKTVPLPVNDILSQSLRKDMSAVADATVSWDVTKNSDSSVANFGDVCSPNLPSSVPATVHVVWTKVSTSTTGVTVTAHVYANNPSAREVMVSVDDAIYKGTDQSSPPLDTFTVTNVPLPAQTETLVMTHTVTLDPSAGDIGQSLNDVATGTYMDPVTGTPIPGITIAKATAVIGTGTVADGTATVGDSESITDTFGALSFSVPAPSEGSFVGYVAGTHTVGPVVWTDSVTSSGSITFNKSIYLSGPIVTSGVLSDTATLDTTSQSLSSLPVNINVSSTASVALTISKTIPSGYLQQAGDVLNVVLHVDPLNVDFPIQFVFGGPTTIQVPVGTHLAPDLFTVSETFQQFCDAANGCTLNTLLTPLINPIQVDLSVPANGDMTGRCSGRADLVNRFAPKGVRVQAQKITFPPLTAADPDYLWTLHLASTGPTTCDDLVVGAGAGYFKFQSGGSDCILGDGHYTITESLVGHPGWIPVPPLTCSFDVDNIFNDGQTFSCTFTNRKLAHASLFKTKSGVLDTSPTDNFEFQIRQGADLSHVGTILADKFANLGDNFGANFGIDLTPGATYQFCEIVMPGWKTSLLNTFVPNGNDPLADSSVMCVNFTLGDGENREFRVDNTPPVNPLSGRTIGFWKNWASCSSSFGKQHPILDQTLAAMDPTGVVLGQYFSLHAGSCQAAVYLLSKTATNGVKKSGDPIFNMVAQMVGVELNIARGDQACGKVVAALSAAQALLTKYHFVGTGYTGNISKADQVTINNLATEFDNYNNDKPSACL